MEKFWRLMQFSFNNIFFVLAVVRWTLCIVVEVLAGYKSRNFQVENFQSTTKLVVGSRKSLEFTPQIVVAATIADRPLELRSVDLRVADSIWQIGKQSGLKNLFLNQCSKRFWSRNDQKFWSQTLPKGVNN